MKRYEFVEHTADIAVLVYGGSLSQLFISAALAMSAVLVAKKKNRSKPLLKEIIIEQSAENAEDLLKGWLDDLLFYFSSQGYILHRIKSLEAKSQETRLGLKARILFDSLDNEYYQIKDEIKAVTYHELKVEKQKEHWRAHIIFDV